MASMDGYAQGINSNLAKIAQAMTNKFALSAFQGTFIMAAASTKTVTDANVKASSVILLMGTNAAAGTLEAGTNKPYVSALNAGVSFVLTTAAGGSAAGTEAYSYVIVNVG